jgi:hypothetical protein
MPSRGRYNIGHHSGSVATMSRPREEGMTLKNAYYGSKEIYLFLFDFVGFERFMVF